MNNNLSKEQAESVISTLAHMRLRPGMYFDGSLAGLQGWWTGFAVACTLFDIFIFDYEDKICQERGWKVTALGAFPHMREKGLTEDEMIVESITIIIQSIQANTGASNEPIMKIHKLMRESHESRNYSIHNGTPTTATHQFQLERAKKLIELMDKIEADMQNSQLM